MDGSIDTVEALALLLPLNGSCDPCLTLARGRHHRFLRLEQHEADDVDLGQLPHHGKTVEAVDVSRGLSVKWLGSTLWANSASIQMVCVLEWTAPLLSWRYHSRCTSLASNAGAENNIATTTSIQSPNCA